MYTGPHIKRDGLVFGMDTGYGIADNNTTTRFYPGEPTTNLVPSGQSIGTSAFQRQGSHVEVFTYSQITNYEGRPHVHRLYINPTTSNPYADYGGQYYKSGGSVVGDVYTISFDYYITKGTGTPGMVVVYANGYKTPTSSGAASLSSATVIDLEDGWKRKTQTATITTAGNSWFRLGLNSNSVETEVYIDNFQVELKSHVTPYISGTRSSTQSLIDLTKTTDIDVSNVSFDSTGQPTFDGTDDGIQISTATNLSSYSALTYEGVVKGAGIGAYDRWFSGTSGTSVHYPDLAIDSSGLLRYLHSSFSTPWVSTGVSITTNKYNHIVFTFQNNGNTELFLNGSSLYTASHNSGTFPSVSRFMIGSRYDRNGEAIVGQIPVMKIYSRALSLQEVKQNFRAYKNRFGL